MTSDDSRSGEGFRAEIGKHLRGTRLWEQAVHRENIYTLTESHRLSGNWFCI